VNDRDLIVEALARMSKALDSRDWATVRELYTPDAEGYGSTGIDAIVATLQNHLGGVGPTQHLLGNHRVEVDGDHARSLTYARVYHQGAGSKEGSFFECLGEYDDRWTLVDGAWRIRSRWFEMQIMLGDFTVLRPADA